MNIIEAHSAIDTKEDLERFIGSLKNDLRLNPDFWGNTDLESFLDAMQSWVGAMEHYYRNNDLTMADPPTWKVFGDILMGARIYE